MRRRSWRRSRRHKHIVLGMQAAPGLPLALPLLLVCSALVFDPGCSDNGQGESGTEARVTSSSSTEESSNGAGMPSVQIGRLQLSAGVSSGRFSITAPDPKSHTFDVEVSAPAGADVSVSFETHGPELRIFDSSTDRASCDIEKRRSVCSLSFPALEARQPGPWAVVVRKRSSPPATVRVEIRFAPA